MTQQRTDGTPSAEPATAYLEALRERLAADGCKVTATPWDEHQAVIGSRSDRKARWFGTKVQLFVLAAAVPQVDDALLANFTGWATEYAGDLRGGLPGARNALMVLPTLISGNVQPSATQWAAADARILGTTVIGRPVVVHTPAPGAGRATMYRGGVVWGGMFTTRVLEKASRYYP
ncbi:hypothetical protein SSPS47_16520 [Streptomyces sp. S4.7]|uniref:hypothetical protein n=1 Tax=Streptomyces sp. S4.7 TaxID=2705439 RepID=UPI00139900A9|nr:hypothetical protein [Streptomyces sp. S4.7]QHY96711.1 hypothetical protein SSPS47_16520 [Streptomyces sp. S4.7]